jgi:hypothetical protein
MMTRKERQTVVEEPAQSGPSVLASGRRCRVLYCRTARRINSILSEGHENADVRKSAQILALLKLTLIILWYD